MFNELEYGKKLVVCCVECTEVFGRTRGRLVSLFVQHGTPLIENVRLQMKLYSRTSIIRTRRDLGK